MPRTLPSRIRVGKGIHSCHFCQLQAASSFLLFCSPTPGLPTYKSNKEAAEVAWAGQMGFKSRISEASREMGKEKFRGRFS